VDYSDHCNPKVSFAHATGCPVAGFTSIINFVSENPWVIAVVLLVFGPVLAFFGRKFLPLFLMLIVGFITFCLSMLMCSVLGMLDYIDPTRTGGNIGFCILAFVLSLALAAGAAFLMKHFIKLGVYVLGGIAGWFLGSLLYDLIFLEWVQSPYMLFGSSAFFAALCSFLAYFFEDHVIIASTALLGSYGFIRGISLFAGGFPNEVKLYQELANGTAEFPPAFLLYVVGLTAMFIISLLYQEKKKFKEVIDGAFHKLSSD